MPDRLSGAGVAVGVGVAVGFTVGVAVTPKVMFSMCRFTKPMLLPT